MRPNTLNLESLVPRHVQRFEPYIPSRPEEELRKLYRFQKLYRLNNNENPLGPSPQALEAIAGFHPASGCYYPSGDCFYLRQGLAERFQLNPDQFIVGNGANEVIGMVIHAFCQEGDNIVTADKTFAVYEWVASFSGLETQLVPLQGFSYDDPELLRRMNGKTKIVFLCNPNNPTGTYWDRSRLCRFLDAVGIQHLVVLDEAYAEYVQCPDFPDGISLLHEYPNLIVFRTFSKIYGLAGFRIGYLAASGSLTDMIRRTAVVYSVNALAQVAALAALGDNEHIQRTREVVQEEKNFLVPAIRKKGIPIQADQGCFVMLRMPINDTLVYRKMLQRGIMIRSMTGFRFPNWIRVSIGQHEAMEAFLAALNEVLDDAQ